MTNTAAVSKHKWYPKFDWPRIDNPCVKFPLNDENLQAVKKAEQLAVNQIKTAIKENGDDIAALIIEPIQGEGGDNHFRPQFFRALREICDQHEIFFIYDEVQTGVGMTGKVWCHQHFPGAQPDAIAFGKKTQVCGCLVGKRIEEVENNVFKVSSRLNSTWGGNVTDMVRAQRYTRGRGLMIAFDLPTPDHRNKFISLLMKNGLAVLGCGSKTIRFRPPLNVSHNEADMAIEILQKSLKQFDL
jgi:L-lysine 6-transaminase